MTYYICMKLHFVFFACANNDGEHGKQQASFSGMSNCMITQSCHFAKWLELVLLWVFVNTFEQCSNVPIVELIIREQKNASMAIEQLHVNNISFFVNFKIKNSYIININISLSNVSLTY